MRGLESYSARACVMMSRASGIAIWGRAALPQDGIPGRRRDMFVACKDVRPFVIGFEAQNDCSRIAAFSCVSQSSLYAARGVPQSTMGAVTVRDDGTLRLAKLVASIAGVEGKVKLSIKQSDASAESGSVLDLVARIAHLALEGNPASLPHGIDLPEEVRGRTMGEGGAYGVGACALWNAW